MNILVGVILTEKKSDIIFMIQGHLRYQKVELNEVDVTKYDSITQIGKICLFYFEWF